MYIYIYIYKRRKIIMKLFNSQLSIIWKGQFTVINNMERNL